MDDGVSIETVAEYWNRRPCNIRHSPRKVGTREYFEEVEKRKILRRAVYRSLAQFPALEGQAGPRDGGGLGTDAVNFARADADYTGVGLSEASLALARRRFDLFGLKGTLLHGNAEQLDRLVPAALFDLVYSFGADHPPHASPSRGNAPGPARDSMKWRVSHDAVRTKFMEGRDDRIGLRPIDRRPRVAVRLRSPIRMMMCLRCWMRPAFRLVSITRRTHLPLCDPGR